MKNILILLLTILTFIGCKKDEEESIFEDKPAKNVVKYVIYLSGTKITEYETYVNDTLKRITNYYFSDTLVKVIAKNTEGKTVAKTIYQLHNGGLATSSVDSSFSDEGSSAYRSEYKYSNGYMIERAIYYDDEGEIPVIINRTVENENIIEIELVSPANCLNRYWFNESLNKIDLNFSNGITGKWSKNLTNNVSWNNFCPCGPSMTIASSEYKYELDANGYVIKKVATYTPCYHLPISGKVTRTITTTFYEYKMN